MPNNLKSDLINGAFSQLRISGMTINPNGDDLELALERLEDMASESPFCETGYYFEEDPDLNTPHNVPRKCWQGFKTNLAVRLMPDFGKGRQPDAVLQKQANAGLSTISAFTAKIPFTQYPTRMPKGRGYGYQNRFFRPEDIAPISCETRRMYIDDVQTFTESFADYLRSGETISSYTITSDTGLTVSGDSNTNTAVSFTVTATGTSSTGGDPLLELKIVVTTSDSRLKTKIINFELIDSDIT